MKAKVKRQKAKVIAFGFYFFLFTFAFAPLARACEVPWTIRIQAPDRCATYERLRAAFSAQQGLRWWQRWTLERETAPVAMEELGFLTVIERPEAFPCRPGSQDLCVGVWSFFISHVIEYTPNWPGAALDHEVGHWLWYELDGALNVGHGTADDPFYLATRAWLRFFYYPLPEGHSYRPQLGPSRASPGGAGIPAGAAAQAGMPAPPSGGRLRCAFRVKETP